MDKEINILEHLPPVLREIKEYVEVANIENPVLNAMWKNVENIINNRFIATSNEEGLSRREKMLHMNVPSTETIETRRFGLMARYQEQAPYTNKVIRQLLDSLLGEGRYTFERNTAEKWIKVRLELTVKGQFEAVEMMLERVSPQNMVLHVTLRYNQHSTLARYTHAQLAAFTHKQLREDVLP